VNIFPTSNSPWASAEALDDKRLVRQASEAVIILSTACAVLDLPAPYGVHQPEHGLIQWLAADPRQWLWGWHYALACNLLYTKTYGRRCVSEQYLDAMIADHRVRFGRMEWCKRDKPPAFTFHNAASNQALGLDFRDVPDTLEAYRLYLSARWLLDKRPPVWTGRPMPGWRV